MFDPRNMANSLGGITEYADEALDTLIEHYGEPQTSNKFGAWRQQDADICKKQVKNKFQGLRYLMFSKEKERETVRKIWSQNEMYFSPKNYGILLPKMG